MTNLKKTIMTRDSLTSVEADEQILNAQEDLQDLLEIGDTESAYEICAIHFSLEPDYLMDLM